MYNCATDLVPPFLPVLTEVQLKPWFSPSLLATGMELIRKGQISSFFFRRNCVGACFDGRAILILQFEESRSLSQGFVIKNDHCGICGHAARKKRCVHLAALAILAMMEMAGEHRARPIPMLYSKSNWVKIADFFHEWLGRKSCQLESDGADPDAGWRLVCPTHGLTVWLPPDWLAAARHLLRQEGEDTEAEGRLLATALTECASLTMTPGEHQLLEAGSVGRAWKRDSSFWSWLASMLFIRHGGGIPDLVFTSQHSSFTLQLGSAGQHGALRVELPPEKAWALARDIPFPGESARILPKARECFRVFFNDASLLEVRPSLRLADGQLLDRQEINGIRLGAAWYLPEEGFLPFARVPAEGEFKNPRQPKNSMSLFSFLQSEEQRDDGFYVAPADLETFLAENQRPLVYADNEIDPSLTSLEFCEFPERLCVHGFSERDDWCLLTCVFGIAGGPVTLGEIRKALKSGRSHLPGRKWLKLERTPLAWFFELLDERMESLADGQGYTVRLSYLELFRLVGLMPEVEVLAEDSDGARLAEVLDITSCAESCMIAGIPDHLRAYQANGLAWLLRLVRFGLGGLLADDMGLGKTHQGLALVQLLLAENHGGRVLIVCPASVVLHWLEKIDRFYPGLDCVAYHGPQRNFTEAGKHAVVITTYGIVRRDAGLLQNWPLDLVLLDEIQHLKNRQTAAHAAVAGLRSRVRIGLTGTPLENAMEDLYALFTICLPGLLGGERSFINHFVKPITERNSDEARARLGRLIDPFILRRTRSQVLSELPELIEDNLYCELSGDQVALYNGILEMRAGELAGLEGEEGEISFMQVLSTLIRLKQVCCHPCLLAGCRDPDNYACGKWELFVELSGELLGAGLKVVVFSQYLGMLEMMEEYFRGIGVGVATLRGSMSLTRRQQMIGRFNNDPDCRVFCASLLAGGVGIDLTGAQAVIHYDRWWNPAKEAQATARVHRMGQKNVVQMFHLITVDSLEEKIHRLLEQKRALSDSLIREDDASIIKQLDRRQLAGLLHRAASPQQDRGLKRG